MRKVPKNGKEALSSVNNGGSLMKTRPRKGTMGNQTTQFVDHYYEGGMLDHRATVKMSTDTVTGHDVIPNISTPI